MLKAIETVYNGYRFRSRLEARWAVFFDTLGVPYEYEKEGYELPGGVRYLPDFWLPEQKCFIEIKGQEPNDEEWQKAEDLASWSGGASDDWIMSTDDEHSITSRVFIFAGEIEDANKYYPHYWLPSYSCCVFRADTSGGGPARLGYWQWMKCPLCGRFDLARTNVRAEAYWPLCGCHQKFLQLAQENHWLGYAALLALSDGASDEISKAYTAARSARFEHGAQGGA